MDALSGERATAVTRSTNVGVGGTASTLALSAFRTSVEQRRNRHRNSEGSLPRSVGRDSLRNSIGGMLSLVQQSPSVNNLLAASDTPPQPKDPPSPKRKPPPPPEPTSASSQFVQNVINSSPGSYIDDDGSEDIADRYNFYAHGRRYLFATKSLGYFDEKSAFRRRVIWLVTSRAFDQLVLALIFANSIILALPDLSRVNAATGDLDTSSSLRNAVVAYADIIFTTLFAVECSLKIVAMGLIIEKGAYLMDPWNWIDFVVVFVGIVAFIPGIPNVSGLRALRVLRPLRFLNAVPGIKRLVTALLKSIPELLSVVAFLFFLFFLYGVIGVQLWSGVLHSRCRLTPFPVTLDPTITMDQFSDYESRILANASLYRCRDAATDAALPLHDAAWTHDSSPWMTARLCYWPVADGDDQTCNLDADATSSKYRACAAGQTCGSDYDNFGNFRFTHPDPYINKVLLNRATFTASLNFGVTSFDHIGSAALILFTCMPREGWSDIMYMLQDAGYGAAAAVYFISFVLLGSFFMLNLALAVIWENFSDQSFKEAEVEREQEELEAARRRHTNKRGDSSNVSSGGVPALQRIVDHPAFAVLRTLLILINTVTLSLDQYPIDIALNNVVDVLNFVLTVAFTIEATLKFMALGQREWIRDGYNIFDAVVAIVSVTEVCLSPPALLTGDAAAAARAHAFTGLRSIRIFALFKLARYWPSLQKLLSTIVSTIKEIGNFSVLLLLFMYIYALIGMQLFGNRFRFDTDGYPVDFAVDSTATVAVPRANFDTILWSMVTIFQILTGENWSSVLLDGWRSIGWSCTIYFISLVVMGNFILLNLFLAILLGNFEDQQEDVERLTIEREELRRKSRVIPMRSSSFATDRQQDMQNQSRSQRRGSTYQSSRLSSNLALPQATSPPRRRGSSGDATTPPPMSALALAAMSQKSAKNVLNPDNTRTKTPIGRSLNLFGPRSAIRKNAWAIVHHPAFDRILLVLVVTSTVGVALDNPLTAPDALLRTILSYADMLLTSLFVVEIALKVIAQGLYFQTDAYLKNNWNVMDLVITAVAVVGLQADSSKFRFLQKLRTFRALRPLRLINRNAGMKLVVSSLFAAVPQIVNVLMVVLLMLTIFSILAVNSLKGKLYSCNGAAFDALLPSQQQLITYPRSWSNLTMDEQQWFHTSNYTSEYAAVYTTVAPTSRLLCTWLQADWRRTIPQSFDNVLLGWRTFFEISTTEGWVTIMLASVDATDIDMQPIPNHRERWTVFFIAFIFFGSFFVVQLFIGVVIENFNRMKEKLDGTFLLSSSQREWLMISEAMLNMRPLRKMTPPRHKLRKLCFRITITPTLETTTMGCIILNTFLMALTYFGEEDLYRMTIEYSNYFFAIVFTIEAAVKMVGLGRYYWKDKWNIFDFAIVAGSFFGMMYTWIGGNAIGTTSAMIRSVRVARLVKLIQTWPSLRQLTNTLLITLPSLVSIGGLLFLVFFIYAAMGVQLFAKTKLGRLVTARSNFQSISRAMITLMRCATGERWNDLMHELAADTACVVDPDYDPSVCGFSDASDCLPLQGCGTSVAFVYFCSFTMLVTFVLLNILIAVILEGFANEKDRANGVLLPEHYESFVTTWSLQDPEATGYLEWHELPKFLQELPEPLGFGDYLASVKEMQLFIQYLDFAMYGGNKVYFYDVARKLGKFVLDVVNGDAVEDLPSNIEVDQKWRALLRGSKIKKLERATHRVNHVYSAILLHEAVTSLVFREELKMRVDKFTDMTKTMISADAPAELRQRQAKRKGSRHTSSKRLSLAIARAQSMQGDDHDGENTVDGNQKEGSEDVDAFEQFFDS